MSYQVDRDLTPDAVIVIPGIMGSELVETATTTTVWGLADVGWYCQAWTSGGSMEALAVTEDERAGRSDRIRATRMLRFPAFAPFLRGVEPYSALLNGLRRVVVHPDAIAEFPYDWRLSVEHNARLLARSAEEHVERWRAHPNGSREAKLVLVAHSMGGLIARYFTTVLGGAPEVRATVTLGTPYHGAVKAAVILGSGRGSPIPLPRRRLRQLALTSPGVHDLLPSYRCVDEGDSVRRLTASDVAALGGDAELAREAFGRREQLLAGSNDGVHALVGVEQRTMQSLVLRDGVVEAKYYTCESAPGGDMSRVDRWGDSTVYRDAAAPVGLEPSPLPQRHGAIAKTSEAIAFVRATLTSRPLGPPLAGLTALRLEIPDMVAVGQPFDVVVSNIDNPTGIGCVVEHAHSQTPVAHPDLRHKDGVVAGQVRIQSPGIYRIQVKGGSTSAVSDLVMVT